MKISLYAAGLGLACGAACTSAGAQSSITLGGTLDIGVRQVRNGSVGTVRSEVSGANSTSKLVIRGVEDLGDGSAPIRHDLHDIVADFVPFARSMGSSALALPAGHSVDRHDRRRG